MITRQPLLYLRPTDVLLDEYLFLFHLLSLIYHTTQLCTLMQGPSSVPILMFASWHWLGHGLHTALAVMIRSVLSL